MSDSNLNHSFQEQQKTADSKLNNAAKDDPIEDSPQRFKKNQPVWVKMKTRSPWTTAWPAKILQEDKKGIYKVVFFGSQTTTSQVAVNIRKYEVRNHWLKLLH